MAALRTWDFPTGCRALTAGQNSSGELGLGRAQNVVRDFAPLLPPLPGAPALFGAAACGGSYTLLYDEENVATLACGEQDGSSGLAKPQRVLAPLPALHGVRIRALSSGLSHSLALAEDGRVFAWGRNADGTPAICPVQRLPCAACAPKACRLHRLGAVSSRLRLGAASRGRVSGPRLGAASRGRVSGPRLGAASRGSVLGPRLGAPSRGSYPRRLRAPSRGSHFQISAFFRDGQCCCLFLKIRM